MSKHWQPYRERKNLINHSGKMAKVNITVFSSVLMHRICIVDICVLGRALALITQRQWDTIRQSKSVLHICQETTPPSKPHIMDYFFSIVLFVFFIRRKNTRKVDLRVRSVVFTFDTIQKIPRDGWHSPRLIEQFVGTHKFYGFYYTLSIVPKQKTGRQ